MNIQTQCPPHDDLQLAKTAREDADAFAELYRRHLTRVYRYHMARVGNVKDAEDLTSQTFMAALEGIRSFRGSGSFAAWLMGIASKKRAFFFRSHIFDAGIEAAAQVAGGVPTDKAAYQRIQTEMIARALRQISPERADAISLVYFGGLSNVEAAEALGKTESAVKMLVSRGLQDLRERTSLRMEAEQ
jgi:RNA polymerase sigma-70 factor (ECF subfamily)